MSKIIQISVLLLVLFSLCGIAAAAEERIGSQKPVVMKFAALDASNSGLVTNDVETMTPEDLVNSLLGGGVIVSNVQYVGTGDSAGTFTGGTGIIGFEDGIILSTGKISNVIGPNQFYDVTSTNFLPGDTDLNSLITGSTNDATVLEFDFVPTAEIITFEYVFASDEYNEFVNTAFNDVFGFFVNGQNIAFIPGTGVPVAINNVNNGNPFNSDPRSYPEYYINNDLDDGGGSIDTEMDGLTTVFTATALVTPNELNHIKLAIADTSDQLYDSNVFIAGGSFTSPQIVLTPLEDTNPVGTSHELTASVVNETGAPVTQVEVTFTIVDGPHAGLTGTVFTDINGSASWSYAGTTIGTDEIVATECQLTSNSAYKTWTSGGIVTPEFPYAFIPGVFLIGLLAVILYARRE